MKVLVFGSRNGHPDVNRILNGLYRQGDPWTLVITGGGTGVDEQAEAWAIAHGIPTSRHPADWLKHGKAAGPIRNQAMIDEEQPDIGVAFPGGRGTADMTTRALKAGVRVVEVGR